MSTQTVQNFPSDARDDELSHQISAQICPSTLILQSMTDCFEAAVSAVKGGFAGLWLQEDILSLHSGPEITQITISVHKKIIADDGSIVLLPAGQDEMQRIIDTFRSDDPKLLPSRSSLTLELGQAQIIASAETVPFKKRAINHPTKRATPQQELYELAMQNGLHSINVEANLAAKFLTTGKAKLNSVRAFDEQGQPLLSKSCVLNGVKLSTKLQQYLSDSIGKAQRMTIGANPEELGFLISDEAFFQLSVPICQDIIAWAKLLEAEEW